VQGRWSCWAAAAALHDGTDYAGLAKLWKRQLPVPSSRLPVAPASDHRSLLTDHYCPAPPGTEDRRTRLKRLEWQALSLLHWGLTSEQRSERRLARQIARKWLRVDECGEVVFWRKPPKKRRGGRARRTGLTSRTCPTRPKPDRRAERRRQRRCAARRRAQDFLADLGAPLVLKPIPARMRRTTTAFSPPMNTDKRRWKKQKQQELDVVVTKTPRPGRCHHPCSSVSICGKDAFVVDPHLCNLCRTHPKTLRMRMTAHPSWIMARKFSR
jgi:hypothetical protein